MNELERLTIKWVRDFLYERFEIEIKEVVNDKLTWIFYDHSGDVVFRAPMDMVERIMALVAKTPTRPAPPREEPTAPHNELDFIYDDHSKDDWS